MAHAARDRAVYHGRALVASRANPATAGYAGWSGGLVGAAYFDVDGTLVGTNLLHPTWHYLSNQASPWQSAVRLGRALATGPAMVAAEVADRRLFNELLYAQYRGMTEDRLAALTREVWTDIVKPRIYPGARELIRRTRQAGHDVVLVTGSLDLTMLPLAEDLGAQRVIANRLEIVDRVATGRLLQPVVAGPTKARLCAEDARAHGHDLADSFAYSDSYSDVPMLSIVGHPYCVHPDRKLARLAKAYRWPVIDLSRTT
jgi:HAD superfamily hydrolase (TIGR01490 family)